MAAREERLTRAAEAVDRDREAIAARLASLDEREHQLAELEEHRVELERATAALASRQTAFELEESQIAQQRQELPRGRDAVGHARPARQTRRRLMSGAATPVTATTEIAAEPAPASAHLLLVSGDRYRIVEAEGPAPMVDTVLELEDRTYRVIRVTSSPLPADGRRCACLERVG